MSKVGTGNKWVEKYTFFHLEPSFIVNSRSLFAFVMKIQSSGFMEKGSCSWTLVSFDEKIPYPWFLFEFLKQRSEDIVVMMENVGGIKNIIDIGSEHIGRYFVVPQKSLQIVQFSYVT